MTDQDPILPDCEENGNFDASVTGDAEPSENQADWPCSELSLSRELVELRSNTPALPVAEAEKEFQSSSVTDNSVSVFSKSSVDRSDTTVVDTILGFLQALVRSVFSFEDNSSASFLPNYDIDKLAVSQDTLDDFAAIMMSETGQDSIPDTTLAKWTALQRDDDHPQWERRCRELMTQEVLNSEVMRQIETYRGKLRAYLARWGAQKRHSSRNIFPIEDLLTARKVPCANSTDAIRGRLGFRTGVHAWDVKFTGPIGTHCTVGVSTVDSPLHSNSGYMSLVGSDKNSWGWDIVYGNVSHNGRIIRNYPQTLVYTYTAGDTIRLILDCELRELSFGVNNVFLGVAVRDLPMNSLLYPTVGMVYGNLEASLVYLGPPS